MEEKEHQALKELSKSNQVVKRLYAEHKYLDERIRKLENTSYGVPTAEMDIKKLKMEKLQGVEKMLKILAESKKS